MRYRLKSPSLIVILIAFLWVGCSSSPATKAPITDSSPIPSHKLNRHVVSKGDTLYAIAWRFDLDFKELSRANGLAGDAKIYPGQVLTLDVSTTKPASAASRVSTPVKYKPPTVSNKGARVAPSAQTNSTVDSAISWRWPASGPIISKFAEGGGLNKGIDIRGDLGEPVLAAADGNVVYAGSGLRGYGKLLILKHNDQVLSAYAHNSVLKVAEGDEVKAGQTIAEIGYTGTQSAKLHFEIRLDGTPVDPLKFLPKR